MTGALSAILIFGASLLALLQFFAFYCHSLVVKSRRYELSEHAREVSGVTARNMRGDQFKRLLQLIALCPEPRDDGYPLGIVSAYFGLLGFAKVLLSWMVPAAGKWIDSELGGCSYLAAVVLDRRIACSRMLIARQAVPLV
jgi:hypothetical protein